MQSVKAVGPVRPMRMSAVKLSLSTHPHAVRQRIEAMERVMESIIAIPVVILLLTHKLYNSIIQKEKQHGNS